jgi:predicted DsbA family dithiol-disulfide isomerase
MIRQFLVCVMLLAAATACAQPTAEAEPDDGLVARFGDQVVTQRELDDLDELKLQLVAIKQQEYEVTRQHLEQLIFERLVEQAAEAAGVSRADYIKTEVVDKIKDPSEQEITQIMTTYRARLNPDPDTARQQVVGMLRQQGGQQIQAELQKRLFREAGVEILLEPLRFNVEVADHNPSRGAGPDAPITLVEYSDFQCPYCSRVQTTVDEIMRRYPGQVRHVFKHLPLPMHKEAEFAAQASLCAEDQGKFWDFHKWLFANPRRINRDTVVTRAETLKMDVPAFESCLETQRHAQDVRRDMTEANSFGINGTPGFLVNGRALNGARPLDDFIKVIEEELQNAGIEPAAPDAPSP